MFTVLGNEFWNLKINQPTAAMPLQILKYALMPYDSLQAAARIKGPADDHEIRVKDLNAWFGEK